MTKLTIEYSILETFKPFLLGYCNCGCGGILRSKNSKVRFINRHHLKRENHPMWRGGYHRSYGYWVIYKPDYINADRNGYVREHVYNFQEYHKCCMLKWGIVHHIDRNKNNNNIENLQGMMRRDHQRLHTIGNKHNLGNRINTSNRRCSICGSYKTHTNKKGYETWIKDGKGGFICDKCYRKNK